MGLPLARWVSPGVENAPSVDVDLGHGDVDTVGVAVRSLSPVRRNRLQKKQNQVSLCPVDISHFGLKTSPSEARSGSAGFCSTPMFQVQP